VLVIDDDPDMRASVGRLLRSLGINVQLFGSISDFLKSVSPDCPTCLVLDIRLPDQSGLDLQRVSTPELTPSLTPIKSVTHALRSRTSVM
jgi:FixJ family two-component response regulator